MQRLNAYQQCLVLAESDIKLMYIQKESKDTQHKEVIVKWSNQSYYFMNEV